MGKGVVDPPGEPEEGFHRVIYELTRQKGEKERNDRRRTARTRKNTAAEHPKKQTKGTDARKKEDERADGVQRQVEDHGLKAREQDGRKKPVPAFIGYAHGLQRGGKNRRP